MSTPREEALATISGIAQESHHMAVLILETILCEWETPALQETATAVMAIDRSLRRRRIELLHERFGTGSRLH